MKKFVIFLFVIFLVNLVNAEEDKVFILNANYNNGEVKINDVTIKNGFAPDRKIPFESNYKINIHSKEKGILYTKKIEIPLFIYVDVIVNKEIKGNLIKLNQTDFALILPYYDEAGKISILEDDKEVASYNLYPILSFKNKKFVYSLTGILAVLTILVFLVIKKKKF